MEDFIKQEYEDCGVVVENHKVAQNEVEKKLRKAENEESKAAKETRVTKKRKTILLKDPRSENLTKRALKKINRDIELEEKILIALEVSKYPHIYDVCHPIFTKKPEQLETWQQISDALGFEVDKCISIWNSLKRSAKYFAIENKTAESGGQAYSDKWPLHEIMSFYTPPSLRMDTPNMISFFRYNCSTKPQITPTMTEVPRSVFPESTEFLMDEVTNDITRPPEETIGNECLVEMISTMANTFSAYLRYESLPEQQQLEKHITAEPNLKYLEMWSNFDRLISKLDVGTVYELNIEIASLINAAFRRRKLQSQWVEH